MGAIAALIGAALAPGGLALAAAAPPATTSTIALPGEPRTAVVADRSLWVLVDRGGERRVLEIRPGARRPSRNVPIATGVRRDLDALVPSIARPSIAATPGAVWTIDPVTSEVVRVSTSAGTVSRPGARASDLAAGRAGLWTLPVEGTMGTPIDGPPSGPVALRYLLVRLDPMTGAALEGRAIGGPPSEAGPSTPVELAVGAGRLWVSFLSPSRHRRQLTLGTNALTASAPAGGSSPLVGTRWSRRSATGAASRSSTAVGRARCPWRPR